MKNGGISLVTHAPAPGPAAGAMSCWATSGNSKDEGLAAPSSDEDASWLDEVRSTGGSDSGSSWFAGFARA